jgi:hypothetical protein
MKLMIIVIFKRDFQFNLNQLITLYQACVCETNVGNYSTNNKYPNCAPERKYWSNECKEMKMQPQIIYSSLEIINILRRNGKSPVKCEKSNKQTFWSTSCYFIIYPNNNNSYRNCANSGKVCMFVVKTLNRHIAATCQQLWVINHKYTEE